MIFLWRKSRHSYIYCLYSVLNQFQFWHPLPVTFQWPINAVTTVHDVSWKQLVMDWNPPWLLPFLLNFFSKRRTVASTFFCVKMYIHVQVFNNSFPALSWHLVHVGACWCIGSYCWSYGHCSCFGDLYIVVNTVFMSVQEYQLCALVVWPSS